MPAELRFGILALSICSRQSRISCSDPGSRIRDQGTWSEEHGLKCFTTFYSCDVADVAMRAIMVLSTAVSIVLVVSAKSRAEALIANLSIRALSVSVMVALHRNYGRFGKLLMQSC